MRARLTMLVALTVLAVVGCGGAEDTAAPDTPLETTTEAGTEDGGVDQDVIQVTGTFGGDAALEGGCAWIEPTDGQPADRIEPIWPEGYQVTHDPLELQNPQGEVVATAGDDLTVTGSVNEDMASICQVGPMFEVEAILNE